ncbi:hypothetical protein ACFQ14_05125 [Pseudahrensia aquimaris]|uniref:Uncharacterized protein n=1 Tax=Pseudahrensia aquimaris TaxID=744461 RepID=A0ABW3FEB0_9HYPH
MSEDHPIDRVERHARTLKEALRTVREERADIDDIAFERRASDRARLEELVEELAPLITDIDPKDDRFEFTIGKGERARLWIDMTSFVAIDHDGKTYRFLKDTRLGRIVLSQTDDVQAMGDIVSHYIAEKIVERERIIEGEWIETKDRALAEQKAQTQPLYQQSIDNAASAKAATDTTAKVGLTGAPSTASSSEKPKADSSVSNKPRRSFISHVGGFLSGIAVTMAAALAAAWAFAPEVFAQIMGALGLS